MRFLLFIILIIIIIIFFLITVVLFLSYPLTKLFARARFTKIAQFYDIHTYMHFLSAAVDVCARLFLLLRFLLFYLVTAPARKWFCVLLKIYFPGMKRYNASMHLVTLKLI